MIDAEIAQLVRVGDSYPPGRWFKSTSRYLIRCLNGGIGRHVRLKIWWAVMPVGVQVPF